MLLPPAAAPRAQLATEVELEQVLSEMSATVEIQSAGDDRLFAVERHGVIRIISFDAEGNASLNPTPFLDIDPLVHSASGEQGLLGLAFHPEYDDNGFFFVNYSCEAIAQSACGSDGDTVVARYEVSDDDDVANPDTALVVATIPQPHDNHNGGQLQFEPNFDPEGGPAILYIATGDGGMGNDPDNNAQDLDSLLGKMLRVDVDNLVAADPLPRYQVPADNPEIMGVVDEIWAYGLRNPWRYSFDRMTGDLFIADVGQGAWEEVNFQAADSPGGENYGWRQCEGAHVNTAVSEPETTPEECEGNGGLTAPILEYGHDSGCSITGGYIYRGVEFASSLEGTYFYADFCSGQLWGARRDNGGGWTVPINHSTDLAFTISTFGQDNHGEIYLATLAGNLYRIRPVLPDLPDLVVTSLDGPTEGVIGDVIDVASTDVTNQGTAGAGATELGYYFTDDATNHPNQTFSGSVCPIPALGTGLSHTCEDIMVAVPDSLAAGPYSLVAIVDDQDNVAESDEVNNDLAAPAPIDLTLACMPQGSLCTGDSDCCSLKCRGGGTKTCKGETGCTPSEPTEASCGDGLDNDCDGFTDAFDPDCGAICEPAKGASCTVDSDCCSNKCRGPNGNKSCK